MTGAAVREQRLTVAGPGGPIPTVLVTPQHISQWGTVVMLHGQGMSKERWVTRARHLAVEGVSVLLPDARLHGERQVPGLDVKGDLPILAYLAMVAGTAADVSAILDELADPDAPSAVWGFSMGGQIALVATARDERLQGMVVLGAPVRDEPYRAEDYPVSHPHPDELARHASAVDIRGKLDGFADRSLLFVHGSDDEYTATQPVHNLVGQISRTRPGPRSIGLLTYGGGHHPADEWLELVDRWLIATLRTRAGHDSHPPHTRG